MQFVCKITDLCSPIAGKSIICFLHEVLVSRIMFIWNSGTLHYISLERNLKFHILHNFPASLLPQRVNFYIDLAIIHGNYIRFIFLLYVCHSHNSITFWVENISWNLIFFLFCMQLMEVKMKYKLFVIYTAVLFYVIFVLVWLLQLWWWTWGKKGAH